MPITTERLILREWQDSDLTAFVRINQDPLVLECMPGPLSAEETAAWVARIKQQFQNVGYGLWAVTLKQNADDSSVSENSSGEFIGYVGLNIPTFSAHFTPCVEIAWRIASEHWNKGYATEAANAVIHTAFNELGITELVSLTVPANIRSINVMKKIGMTRDPNDDFDHPRIPKDHRLSRHVLYRLKKIS